MKEEYKKYTCDECGEELFFKEGHFPYEKGWCYLYNFAGKVLYAGFGEHVKKFEIKDGHYCNKSCMLEHIKKKIDGG